MSTAKTSTMPGNNQHTTVDKPPVIKPVKVILNEQNDLIKTFNNRVRQTFIHVEQLSKNDKTITSLKNKAFSAIKYNDMIVIKSLGPILYNYHERIFKRDAEFFLDQSFAEFKGFDDLIKQMKALWKHCSEAEQAMLFDNVYAMTELYIKYRDLELALKLAKSSSSSLFR